MLPEEGSAINSAAHSVVCLLVCSFQYCPDKKVTVKSQDYKYETDEESRFSDVSKKDELQSGSKTAEDPVVKEEPTYEAVQKRQAKFSRKYGDRVLLARQSADGMMKLGGGNQSMELYPKDSDQRRARMGGRYAKAYSSKWNFGAPQYAGKHKMLDIVTCDTRSHAPLLPHRPTLGSRLRLSRKRWGG